MRRPPAPPGGGARRRASVVVVDDQRPRPFRHRAPPSQSAVAPDGTPGPYHRGMAKTAKRHRCIDCGSTTARWAGRCPTCGEWNTLVEEAALGPLVRAVDELDLSGMPVPLSSVDVSEAAAVPTGVEEFDRVLSGGLVPGSVTLLGGEPGIGKSTLLLQVLAARAAAGHRVLLVSAEESAHQVRLRAERLGPGPPGPAHPVGHRRRARSSTPSSSPSPNSWSSTPSRRWRSDRPPRASGGPPGSPGRSARSASAPTSWSAWPRPARWRPCWSATSPRTGRWPAPGPSSTWSTPCSASRATGTTRSASCSPSSTGSARPGSSACSRWATRASTGSTTRAASCSVTG